jgi:rod shape-determining protein MreD
MALLALQKTLFVEITLFGVIVQVLLAFAASAGAIGGPERGAMAGFVLGLMFDLAVGTPLGVSAITMGLAGHVAGWADRIRIDTTWWLAAGFVALGSAAGESAVPVVRRFIGEQDAFSADLLTIVPVVMVSSAALSVVLVPIAGWALRIERPEWKLAADG